MRNRCSFAAVPWALRGGLVLAAVVGCSTSDDHPPLKKSSRGVGCAKGVSSCDIHDEACRQDVLDVVACMRGYDEPVRQPPTRFLRIEDLLDDSEPDPEQAQVEEDTRRALTLFGLVAPQEVDEQAALTAQVDSIAAIYSNSDGTVYVIENPGGEALSDADVGGSVDQYLMSILAHEYVHYLQDREFDLTKYAKAISSRLDPMLASVSAIEGEAMLYEGFYTYLVSGTAEPESRVIDDLVGFVDFAEAQIREVASPALEARMLFPYTYGAYSAAMLHQADATDDLATLRAAQSTLPYIERRWATVQETALVQPAAAIDLAAHGFAVIAEDNLGSWLVNALFGRQLEFTTAASLDVARQWRGDRLTVWRSTTGDEVVGQWSIAFDEADAQVASWARALARTSSPASVQWDIRAEGNEIVLTSSTEPDSVVYTLQGAPFDSVTVDAGSGSSTDAIDAGAREITDDLGRDAAAGPLALEAGLQGQSARQALHVNAGLPPRELTAWRLPGSRSLRERARTEQRLRGWINRQRRLR